MRPFYFGIVFWGDKFRHVFTDLCLLSLLSGRNIPSLENAGGGNRFLICTTRADWDALEKEATFRLMRDFIEPEFVEMIPPRPEDHKMAVMSDGHRMIANTMFERRVYGTFIYPDTVFSDGTVAALQDHARAGKKAVLANCPRLANEGFLKELSANMQMRPGHPSPLSSRDLVAMALRHIHSETRRYEWDTNFFADSPVVCYWNVSDDHGVVMHSFCWAPLLLDYGSIGKHHTGSLDSWTIDGDYVHANVPEPADIAIITDSDEVMVVSVTPEADLHYEPDAHWLLRLPWIGTRTRIALLRRFYFSPVIDPLKRHIFRKGVFLHTDPLSGRWDMVCTRADRLVDRATKTSPSVMQRVFDGLLIFIRCRRLRPGDRLRYALTYPIAKLPAGFRAKLRAVLGLPRSGRA